MEYLKLTQEDYDILRDLDFDDLGAVTYWLLESLENGELTYPRDNSTAAIVKARWHKNLVTEDEGNAE